MYSSALTWIQRQTVAGRFMAADSEQNKFLKYLNIQIFKQTKNAQNKSIIVKAATDQKYNV